MVLHHVAEHAGRVVVAAAALDVDRLGDVELDVVDVVLVPQRLEHAVGEAERQQVLHRLLAEVVIDAEIWFSCQWARISVELQRRGEVGAERLLDDDPLPAGGLLEAGLVEVGGDQPEERGGVAM